MAQVEAQWGCLVPPQGPRAALSRGCWARDFPLFPIHFFCLVLLGGLLGLNLDFGSPIPSKPFVCSCPVNALFQLLVRKHHFGKGKSALDAGEIVGPQKAGSPVGNRNFPVHFLVVSFSNFTE